MVKWHNTHADEGLVVIEIDNGAYDSLEQVKAWIEREEIPFPVLYDAGGATADRYGIRGYPTQFLIDRDGQVIWQGRGYSSDRPAEIEGHITRALAQRAGSAPGDS